MGIKQEIKEWIPILGLTLSAFIFTSSEFAPIGLLSGIAGDFGTSLSHAGMLISYYAWAVALLSLPLMIAASRYALRGLMMWCVGLFCLFQVCSAMAPGYYTLLASRIGVACTHAIFWSIVEPMAVRISSPEKKSAAIAMVAVGTSLAMVFGLPLGRVIGLWVGWRYTFACIAAAALVVFIWLHASLPQVPTGGKFRLRCLPQMLMNKKLIALYIITTLCATAYLTPYSFIEPFLEVAGGYSPETVTTLIMVYGVSGLLGSIVFSKLYDRGQTRFMHLTIVLMAACLFALWFTVEWGWAVALNCVAWGTVVTMFNVTLTAQVIGVTKPEETAVAMSVNSGIYNVGIASGTMLGAVCVAQGNVRMVAVVGGAVGLLCIIFWHVYAKSLFFDSGAKKD